MMKQAETIVDPPIPKENERNEITIDDEEEEDKMIEVLCEQSQSAPLLKDGKRKLLKKVFSLRSTIFERATLLDVANQTDLCQHFEKIIPKAKTQFSAKHSNEVLSGCIFKLFAPFEMLHVYLLEQEMDKNERGRNVRNSTVGSRKKDEVLALSEEVMELKGKVQRRVMAVRNEERNPLKRGFLPLSLVQSERTFSKKMVPKDRAHQKCMMCGHFSINEQIENKGIMEHNKEVKEVYDKKMEVWKEFKEKERANAGKKDGKNIAYPKDPTDPKRVMKMKPKMGITKVQRLQCMCSTSKCISKSSDICSTCPIKCRDPATGTRYSFEPHCTCPICTCTCTASYGIDEFHKLSIDIAMYKAAEKKKKGGVDENEESNQNIQSFISTMFNNSVQSAISSATKNRAMNELDTNDLQRDSSKKMSEAEYNAVQDSLYESMALNIAREGPQLTTELDRRRMASLFGTETTVSLPNGQTINTKALGQRKNQHGFNNNLIGHLLDDNDGTGGPFPGMIDNMHLSLANPCDHWKKASGIYGDPDVSFCSSLATITPNKKMRMNFTDGTSKNMINLSSDEEECHKGSKSMKKNVVSKKMVRGSDDTKRSAWEQMRDRRNKKSKEDRNTHDLQPERFGRNRRLHQ